MLTREHIGPRVSCTAAETRVHSLGQKAASGFAITVASAVTVSSW